MEDNWYSHEEQKKANDARQAFKNCEFQKAADILKLLQQKRPNDFRIKHNSPTNNSIKEISLKINSSSKKQKFNS